MKKAIVGNTVHFTFGDGLPPYIFDCAVLSEQNKMRAVPVAMSHRLGDNAALSRTDKDGNVRNITEAMRREAIVELGAHYESGSPDWSPKTRASTRNPVWEQIAAKRGITYEEYVAERAAADLAELEQLAG